VIIKNNAGIGSGLPDRAYLENCIFHYANQLLPCTNPVYLMAGTGHLRGCSFICDTSSTRCAVDASAPASYKLIQCQQTGFGGLAVESAVKTSALRIRDYPE
jgi:hypothetical protein